MGNGLPPVVSPEEWRAARVELLRREKELTRLKDEVHAARRRLPMVDVTDRDYRFHGPQGDVGLGELFEGRRQLIVYHFMFDPAWDEGCPACSHTADNIGHLSHLHARDTTLVLVSRAPLEKLRAYRERMGWTVPWYSSAGSRFNYDFHVTLDADVAPVEYNYRPIDELVAMDPAWEGWSGEEHGVSCFLRDGDRLLHTYSAYARATDWQVNTYNYLDLTVLGRQEDWEQPPGRSDGPMMHWLRRHDRY